LASTIELARTIARSQQFIRLSPLTFTENTANDPAFSNADWVMQTILAPPFAWRWNRASGYNPQTPTFTTAIGQSDYQVSLPNFGWLEKAVAYDPADGFKAYELQVALVLANETVANQPARISTQYDNGSGMQTFRIFPAPDKVYNVVLEFQNAAPLFVIETQTWAPIPDFMSYIYNSGFDYKSYEYMNDPRQQAAGQIFFTSLANAAEGLTESQRNLWLADKLNSIREMSKAQPGQQGR